MRHVLYRRPSLVHVQQRQHEPPLPAPGLPQPRWMHVADVAPIRPTLGVPALWRQCRRRCRRRRRLHSQHMGQLILSRTLLPVLPTVRCRPPQDGGPPGGCTHAAAGGAALPRDHGGVRQPHGGCGGGAPQGLLQPRRAGRLPARRRGQAGPQVGWLGASLVRQGGWGLPDAWACACGGPTVKCSCRGPRPAGTSSSSCCRRSHGATRRTATSSPVSGEHVSPGISRRPCVLCTPHLLDALVCSSQDAPKPALNRACMKLAPSCRRAGVRGRPQVCGGHLVRQGGEVLGCTFAQPPNQALGQLPAAHAWLVATRLFQLGQTTHTVAAHVCRPRKKMREERLPIEDGIAMRSLANFPGGLELHIGCGPGAGGSCEASCGCWRAASPKPALGCGLLTPSPLPTLPPHTACSSPPC